MDIKWGSLYTVVGNLEKHGFLAVEGSVREGARPERTVYRILDEGMRELADWVRELIAAPEREVPRFEAGLSVLGALGPDETAALLRRRLDALERQIAGARAALAAAADVPRIFLIEDEYDPAIRSAEAAWVRGFLAELEDGSLPGLDLGRSTRSGPTTSPSNRKPRRPGRPPRVRASGERQCSRWLQNIHRPGRPVRGGRPHAGAPGRVSGC